jgi:integrase
VNLEEAIEYTYKVRQAWSTDSKTYPTLRSRTRSLLQILDPNLDIKDITNSTCLLIIEEGKKRGVSNGTINQYQVHLKTVVSTLIKYGYLEKPLVITKLKESKGRTAYFKDEEVKAVLDACLRIGTSNALITHDVVKFAYLCGCRQGEALNLKWEHIDWDGGTLCFYDTKNGSDRRLPLTDSLRSHLQSVYDNADSDELVFPIAQSTLHCNFVKAKKLAGVSSELVFHSLRHGAATRLFDLGCNLPTAKQILGHRTTETTLRYAKSTDKAMETALQSLQF